MIPYLGWLCACSFMSDSLWPYGLQPTRLLCPWDFPGKNTGVDCHCLLHGIFLTPGIELTSPAAPALAVDSLPQAIWEVLILGRPNQVSPSLKVRRSHTPDSPSGLEESEKLCCGPPLERLGGEDLRAALSWLSARKCDLSPANARNRIQLKIWMSQTGFRVPDKTGALAHTMISALWEAEQRARLHRPQASDPWKLYSSNYESKS